MTYSGKCPMILTQVLVLSFLVLGVLSEAGRAGGDREVDGSVTGTPDLANASLLYDYPPPPRPTASTVAGDKAKEEEMEDSLNLINLEDINELMLDPLNRNKRQALAGLAGINLGLIPNGQGNPNSAESLLASCQLTNLLMYQLLQQKQQQSQLVTPAISPFAAINQNLIFPLETLSTYLSTSTYTTDMTTTALVTIPLLFGNKPISTTITRTKTYQVTTSEVYTLTSTIRPTFTQLPSAALMSTAESQPLTTPIASEETLEVSTLSTNSQVIEPTNAKSNRVLAADELPTSQRLESGSEEKVSKSGRNSGSTRERGGNGKRRNKARTSAKIGSDNLHTNLKKQAVEPTSSNRRGEPAQYKILRDNRNRARTNPQQPQSYVKDEYTSYNEQPRYESYQPTPQRTRGTTAQERQQQQPQQNDNYYYRQRVPEPQPDPEYVQYPDDYSYYARRLKRGQGQDNSEEYPLERDLLLEPSFQEDFSHAYGNVVEGKCPPASARSTVTLTETHTITKFLNPTTCSAPAPSRGFSRGTEDFQRRGSTSSNSNSNSSGRSRSRFRSTTTTTEEPPLEEYAGAHRQRFVSRPRTSYYQRR